MGAQFVYLETCLRVIPRQGLRTNRYEIHVVLLPTLFNMSLLNITFISSWNILMNIFDERNALLITFSYVFRQLPCKSIKCLKWRKVAIYKTGSLLNGDEKTINTICISNYDSSYLNHNFEWLENCCYNLLLYYFCEPATDAWQIWRAFFLNS